MLLFALFLPGLPAARLLTAAAGNKLLTHF
jgi:hypothetical protein